MNDAKQNESGASPQKETAIIEAKLTPEQEEEMKLRMKYPNPQKPGGSAFIQKMLHKGSKKYFDSGDYNMAKSKIKALNGGNKTTPLISIEAANQAISNNENNPNLAQTEKGQTQSLPLELTNSPSIVVIVDSQLVSPTASDSTTADTNTPTSAADNLNDSITFNPTQSKLMTNQILTPTMNSFSHSLKSPLLSSSISSNNINTSLNNSAHMNSLMNPAMPSSLSTNSISMLSSSISVHNLSKAIPSCIIDSDEISYTIPTPECLPQSRKHSIVQSKLATPRLSTS